MATYNPTMTAADALLWNIEQDPVLRTTITAVALLDRAPDWERLLAKLERGAVDVPRLRQKALEPSFALGPPEWVDDPDFDLRYHVRRVVAPAPGTLRAALDIAEPLSMAGFDRNRPLWEFTVVEGLEDGQAALIQKLHHSVADGIGGIKLAAALLDFDRDADGPEAATRAPVTLTTPTDAAARALRRRLGAMPRLATQAPGVLAGLARRPLGAGRDVVAMARSAAKILAPASGPTSPLLVGRTLGRRFDVIDVPLEALTAAAHDAGCHLNAAYLAAAVGGTARYHEKHGSDRDRVRIDMPVNIRDERDPEGGNRFAPTRFFLPMDVHDPVERMRAVGAVADSWRAEPALAITDILAGALNALPRPVTTSVFASMLKGVDMTITNVPGLPMPTYIAGAEVVREWALAPPSGAAISVALLSHVDTACIGIVCDTGAVHDVDGYIACMVDGFDEVLGGRGTATLRS